jgi:two-component system sensor histidine kinase KdpD
VQILLKPNAPPVQADFGMLERVIANIAENAQKHAGRTDIVITSAVSGTVRGFPAGELRLRDHGRGVGADGMVRMFRPFQRLDDAGPSGVGLGLAVARGFTEVMGGELVAEPAPGGGLTMIIRLPLSTGIRQ